MILSLSQRNEDGEEVPVIEKEWPAVLTPAQAREYLGGVSERTFYRWVSGGLVRRFKAPGGRVVRYRRTDLDRFLDQFTKTGRR